MKKLYVAIFCFLLLRISYSQDQTINGNLNVNGRIQGANNSSIIVPGNYNFERIGLMQLGNGNSALEIVNHVSLTNSTAWQIGMNVDTYGTGLFFRHASTANNYGSLSYKFPSVFFSENGNVGIGTTAPYGKLHVFSQKSPSNYYDGELHVGGFIGHTEDITLILGTHYNNKTTYLQGWRAGFGSTPILIQPQGGNVGIGTTSPLTKLHIEGSSANWDESTPGLAIGSIHMSTGTSNDHFGNAITWGASDASWAQAGIYTRSDGTYGTKMYFATTDSYWTGSKTRMFINADGNIGIGTTTPSAKLAVNGDIKAKEVNVTLEGWADFVFKPNYNLRPLSEVEQFIKTNNHLPEIPSEAEVKENGIGLGEMNAKLLQKVEELTLYLIEQQKILNAQNNKIQDLENKINSVTLK